MTDYARQQAPPTDSVSMMEFYMKKAAQEDLRKPQYQSKDEIPVPVALPLPPESMRLARIGLSANVDLMQVKLDCRLMQI